MFKTVSLYFLLCALVICTFFILVFFVKLKLSILPAYFLAINITLVLLYLYDKLTSIFSWLRAPEGILHFISAIGATPAAYLSQKLFRHKTSKESFQNTFKKIVAIQAVLLLIVGMAIIVMA